MKKLLAIIMVFIAFLSNQAMAQFTLEHSYQTTTTGLGQEFFLTDLGNRNYKYVIYDYDSARFSLYNLDHTPFMTEIQIPVHSDAAANIYYRLGYITTSLFDCDSTTVEYAMMSNYPVALVHPNFGIYRTDGTELFAKDSVGTVFCVGCGSGSVEMHPIMNTSDGAKLYLYENIPDGYRFLVYGGFCGTVPEGIFETYERHSFVRVFPNPTSHQINFEITSPSNYEEYELTIFNSQMQSIKKTKINGIKTQVGLDDAALSSGTYFYSLQGKDKVFQTGKFFFSQ